MLSVHERAQLVAAARLYYESNLTQAQIAQRLNVSRPSVSKMLARARELGIVHIEIVPRLIRIRFHLVNWQQPIGAVACWFLIEIPQQRPKALA